MSLDHYVTLGRSGLRVSPFALGAMTFGEDPGGAGCSVEESEKILDDLVRAGKIRYLGFSNTPAWVTAQVQTTALLRGWTPLVALQVEYSLPARTVEGELVPFALDQGLALTPWSPLKNGFLSGKYRRDASVTDSARAAFVGGPSDGEYAVIDVVASIASSARGGWST